jgi:NhaP-type Na+/H+ and K+/H+ antiporter
MNRWFSVFCHVSFGIISGFFGLVNLPLSVFLYLQFLMYEFVEESKLKDELFYELREFSLGYLLGLLLGWIVIWR